MMMMACKNKLCTQHVHTGGCCYHSQVHEEMFFCFKRPVDDCQCVTVESKKETFVVIDTKTSSVDGHFSDIDEATKTARDRCKNGKPHEVCKVIARYKQSDEIIEETL